MAASTLWGPNVISDTDVPEVSPTSSIASERPGLGLCESKCTHSLGHPAWLLQGEALPRPETPLTQGQTKATEGGLLPSGLQRCRPQKHHHTPEGHLPITHTQRHMGIHTRTHTCTHTQAYGHTHMHTPTDAHTRTHRIYREINQRCMMCRSLPTPGTGVHRVPSTAGNTCQQPSETLREKT